jgi:dTDP-4-dehydrorhamnose 3,5-epimerase
VLVRELRQIRDERGAVMHVLRADAPWFERFGEVYVSLVRPGAVKAWKRHRVMTQHYAVPLGSITLVIHDDRPESADRGACAVIRTGGEHYGLIRIPAMLWYGFRGEGPGDALIVNCASHPHDRLEVESLPPDSAAMPYSWTATSDG